MEISEPTRSKPTTPTLPPTDISTSPFNDSADVRPIPIIEIPSNLTRQGKTIIATICSYKQDSKVAEKEAR